MTSPGFYGKTPGLGDFVTRRLPRTFLDSWDAWLQEALVASRGQLGEQWLDAYLTSPLWRFILTPEACGPEAWAGVLMPSVDRVGRYFPLTVAAPVSSSANPFVVASAASAWFGKAETLLLSTLEREEFDVDGFDTEVETLGSCVPDAPEQPALVHAGDGTAWHLGLESVEHLGATFAPLLGFLVERSLPSYSLWWTAGSELVRPSLLICRGLPPGSGFAALLDGHWRDWSWNDLPLTAPEEGIVLDPSKI